MSKFRAINDSVILHVVEPPKESRSEFGLVLIEKDVSATTVVGTVVSVGDGKLHERTGAVMPVPLKVGDKVVIPLSTGVKLDAEHRMVRTDDIFAVVEE